MPQLCDVLDVLEAAYDPDWAESWDSVGLVCGDPAEPVRRVLFAVDPVAAVLEEALEWGADLIVAHHPLFLRGVNGVAATTPKGRLVHRLIRANIALYTAHTNADVARPGVSDALARAVGLTGPLRPIRPVPGADPQRSPGLGRIGLLSEPMSLGDFAAQASAGLPETAGPLRVAGDPDAPVHRVAVCGGAGDSLLEDVRAGGVDVYLTADLRHHPASEFMEVGGPALIDAAHWATEWPWLRDAAALVESALGAQGTTVETRVSATVTDAWTTVRDK
ncbi:Nif3-like dinuclear metal center hexameric protein [Rhizohabitans arisaemae]|uniref:Nif3-like dinuclear metal center hexameric protein n=1 Tax=Rhizohabitans arisaemae TaxID=2720610 RepID=UPI0024B0F402|nr:Nif3-like dinuclear metal center hexameric protein [Rhizohabitans arisaemae]